MYTVHTKDIFREHTKTKVIDKRVTVLTISGEHAILSEVSLYNGITYTTVNVLIMEDNIILCHLCQVIDRKFAQ